VWKTYFLILISDSYSFKVSLTTDILLFAAIPRRYKKIILKIRLLFLSGIEKQVDPTKWLDRPAPIL